jgi:glycosyltransferase involved in cell wall biosynthesis
MKILQINNNHYRKSGTDSVYLNLIELLRKNGHKVIPFSFQDKNNISEENDDFFVNKSFFYSSFGKIYSRAAKNNLERLILTHKPDVAHFHNIIGGLSLSILPILKKYSIPTVATVHGFKYLCPAYVFINGKGEICEKCKQGNYYNCILSNCAPEGRIKSAALTIESYFRDIFLPITDYIDGYIFLSQFFLNKFVEVYPKIKNKSVFFYNFINDFEANYSINKGDYYLYFGRLDREKGINTLLKAFSVNLGRKLKIIGDGQLSEFVKISKTDNVEYLGYKDWNEIQKYLLNASFVIIPSECYENNPMTIIESYSMGKPVIGSNLGGIPEIISQGETGFTFESKNIFQLSNVLEVADKIDLESYRQMSKKSIRFAKENFSSDIYYEKLLDVYNSVIK